MLLDDVRNRCSSHAKWLYWGIAYGQQKYLQAQATSLIVVISSCCHPNCCIGPSTKGSASLITYDTVNKTIQMECKVFIDDFQRSLLNSVAKGTDPSKVRRQDRHRLVEAYFELFYTIEHNGKRIPLKLSGIQPLKRQNVLVIRFAKVPVKMQKGDSLRIQNTMFFRDFGAAQSNRIAVRIPRD